MIEIKPWPRKVILREAVSWGLKPRWYEYIFIKKLRKRMLDHMRNPRG